MKRLSELLKGLVEIDSLQDKIVTGLSIDSRCVEKGDLFFAYQGYHTDGKYFIDIAHKKGAIAILSDAKIASRNDSIIIYLKNLKSKLGLIASRFFDHPSKKMTIIGVTGTNGKTSVCYLLAQALAHLGQKAAIVSTLGNGLVSQLTSATMTTPDAISLQQSLASFVKNKVDTAIIEVSSHALHQKRVANIDFDYGIFTNLTRDHLDYHLTMEHYAACKKSLFASATLKVAVINADDAYGASWINSLKRQLPVYSYSFKQTTIKSVVKATQVQCNLEGIKAQLITKWGQIKLTSALIGHVNLSNLLAVITVLKAMDMDLSAISGTIPHLHPPIGRMEIMATQPLVICDYAHTTDSLAKALITLKRDCLGKLFCVFGCGGNRDRGKRGQMAKSAQRYAHQIILTSDNARYEKNAQIIADIVKGFSDKSMVTIITNRKKAIAFALQHAGPQDTILIAGKGHEITQEINGKRLPFNERAIIKTLVSNNKLHGDRKDVI